METPKRELRSAAEPAEFVVGQPVVEISLMRPGVISAVNAYRGDYGGSVRYSYDLVDGSRGLNDNELEAVTGMQHTPGVPIRYNDGAEQEQHEPSVGEPQLVTSGGDLVSMPSSVEFHDRVKSWLKMPKGLIDMGR